MYHWHRRSTGAHASISFAAFSLDFLFPFLLFLLSLFSLFFLFCMSWPRTVNLLHRSSDDDAVECARRYKAEAWGERKCWLLSSSELPNSFPQHHAYVLSFLFKLFYHYYVDSPSLLSCLYYSWLFRHLATAAVCLATSNSDSFFLSLITLFSKYDTNSG